MENTEGKKWFSESNAERKNWFSNHSDIELCMIKLDPACNTVEDILMLTFGLVDLSTPEARLDASPKQRAFGDYMADLKSYYDSQACGTEYSGGDFQDPDDDREVVLKFLAEIDSEIVFRWTRDRVIKKIKDNIGGI